MDNREFPVTCLENMYPNLYKAAMKGDMELLTSIVPVASPTGLIVQGASPPDLTLCLTPQKNTALHIAVKFEQQKIVKRMIQQCSFLISQPNSKGDTPLHVAARAGHLDLTKLLTPALNLNSTEGDRVRQAGSVALRTRNSEGSNPIHEALKKSHEEVALHLLAFEERHELACEVNGAGESLLYLAAEAGLDRVVQEIIDSGDYSTKGPDGQNPLHIAVIKGRQGVVKILLDKVSYLFPQPDRFGNTVLHYASCGTYRRVVPEGKDMNRFWIQRQNQLEILKLLLEVNPSLAYVPNGNGDYPLFLAIRKDFVGAVGTILQHCPDCAELVNRKGQNAVHLAVMEKSKRILGNQNDMSKPGKLINEPDDDGNTPMHLATQTDQENIVRLLIRRGPPDLTTSNKEGLTAMDICGYTETKHLIRDKLRESGAVPGRHHWQGRFPPPSDKRKTVKVVSPEFKKLSLQTLPIVTSLVATVTFAAAFTVPGGYKNDGPREGLPVLMRKPALQLFLVSDILAFCSSMAATVLLIYANAVSEDAFKIHHALKTCYCISGVAIVATITAFVTAVYILTSKERFWIADTSLLLGFVGVPLFLVYYMLFLENRNQNDEEFLFDQGGDHV